MKYIMLKTNHGKIIMRIDDIQTVEYSSDDVVIETIYGNKYRVLNTIEDIYEIINRETK